MIKKSVISSVISAILGVMLTLGCFASEADCRRALEMTGPKLAELTDSVFGKTKKPRRVTFLVDMPATRSGMDPLWMERIDMAQHWAQLYSQYRLNDRVQFIGYPATNSNNGSLPKGGKELFLYSARILAQDETFGNASVILADVLRSSDLVFAMTEFSATSPLKLFRPKGFKAASMPGFNQAMIPALDLEFNEVHARCTQIHDALLGATGLNIHFEAEMPDGPQRFEFYVDLRGRKPKVSSGILRKKGDVGNLPSGETFIVPYEGERRRNPSLSNGIIPVQFGSEVVLHRIERNQTTAILSDGPESLKRRRFLFDDPGRLNIAEIGFGILRDLGILPVGRTLLDEKLGLHIAWGMSEHLGGTVGKSQFRLKEWHRDEVYIPETQPKVRVRLVEVHHPRKSPSVLMEDGVYLLN